ncbi:MAG TPA: PadR family transcriptional regulator [Actinomycetota bacterium]|nr:PadR family transcriptional regulator [Actinomycetota bacterium]
MGRRFFRHGELPLVLLALLADRQMHGYELMAELGRLFAPHYSPSPGSVYPAVEALESEGLIRPQGEGGPRVYELTPSGKQALEKRRELLAAIELRTGLRVQQRGTIDAVLDRFASRIRELAGRLEPDSLERILDSTADEIEGKAVSGQAASVEVKA